MATLSHSPTKHCVYLQALDHALYWPVAGTSWNTPWHSGRILSADFPLRSLPYSGILLILLNPLKNNCVSHIPKAVATCFRSIRTRWYAVLGLVLIFFLLTLAALWLLLDTDSSWFTEVIAALVLTLLHFFFLYWAYTRPTTETAGSEARALQESEELFRLLFDNMAQGVIIYDKNMRIVEANQSAARFFGLSAAYMEGRYIQNHPWDIIHEDGTTYNPHSYPVTLTLQTGKAVSKAIMGIRAPASEDYIWLLVDTFPRVDLGGNTIGVYCILTDVTQLKQIELSLRRERWMLEDILESATAGYWDVDRESGSGYYSPSYKLMFGYADDELAENADTWLSLIHPEDRPLIQQALLNPRVIEGRTPFSMECRFRHKNGYWVWVICAGKVLERNDNGEPSRVVGCHFDISSRKQAEKEREQILEHLANMQKLESLGKLAGGVAHDSNNLLQLIMGHAEIALEKLPESHAVHHHLKSIQEASQRSAKLVRQLLTFARKQVIQPIRLNLNQILSGALPILKQLVGDRITIEWQADDDIGDVLADPTQMDQVLSNLCTNAREAIRDSGHILIQTRNTHLQTSPIPHVKNFLPGNYVEIVVADSGEGIPDEITGRIFDPFFTTKPLGDGHGLGLSTVYGIVKQNNGLIHLGKSVYGGASFHIYLPTIETYGTPFSPGQNNQQHLNNLSAPQDVHILLMDDHSNALDRNEQFLHTLGYKVTATTSPADAILLFERDPHAFDLVIVDIAMPGITGMQLIQRLHTSRKDLLWLLISNHPVDEITHGEHSSNHVLLKPYSKEQLAKHIAAFFPSRTHTPMIHP